MSIIELLDPLAEYEESAEKINEPIFEDLEEIYPNELIPQAGEGFLLDLFKRIFKSPITKKVWKTTKRVGKKLLPVVEDVGKSELNRTKKGKELLKVYNEGKKLISPTKEFGKSLFKLMPGKGLSVDDEMFNTIQVASGLYLAEKGKKKLKGTGKQFIMGKGTVPVLNPLTLQKVNKDLVYRFVPQMIENLKGNGLVQYKKYTPYKQQILYNRLDKRKQVGGWIGTALTAASLIPLGIDLATNIVPLISSLFTKGKRKQVGRGVKKEVAEQMGKDIAELVLAEQSGEGIGNIIASAGKKLIPFIKKLLPVIGRIGKAFAPTVESVALGELNRTKKGREIASVYNKGKNIVKTGKNVYDRLK